MRRSPAGSYCGCGMRGARQKLQWERLLEFDWLHFGHMQFIVVQADILSHLGMDTVHYIPLQLNAAQS